jgi:hypothetical protein
MDNPYITQPPNGGVEGFRFFHEGHMIVYIVISGKIEDGLTGFGWWATNSTPASFIFL